MALVSENLTSNAFLKKCSGVYSGRWPRKSGLEGLAYQGPSCGVMAAHAGVDFHKDLSSFFLRYTSLVDAHDALLVEFAFIELISLGSSNDPSCFNLVLGKLFAK